MDGLMKQLINICIAAGLSLFLTTAVQAAMYKWTDEKGNVHYSQHPPRDKQYEKIKKQKAPPPPSGSTPAYQTPSLSQDPGDRKVAEEVAKNKEIRKKNCEAAKNNLKVYSVHRRVKSQDGLIRVVPRPDREKKIAEAKEQIKEFCD